MKILKKEHNVDCADVLNRAGQHPSAIVPLANSLITRQEYSITLELHMPRSPSNLAAGNFMVSLSFLGPSYSHPLSSSARSVLPPPKPVDILWQSRRPAIMTYENEIVSTFGRIINLPWYILGWKKDSEVLVVEMTEDAGVNFPRGGKNLPRALEVQVEREDVQVYEVRVRMRARLTGLRWWMWNWRVGSAIVGILTFWGVEMVGVVVGWGILSLISVGKEEGVGKGKRNGKEIGWKTESGDGVTAMVKKEEATDDEPDLSDTPRTFPTVGRQMPLVYPPAGIKKEEDEEDSKVLEDTVILPLGGDADDEDEDGEESWKVGEDWRGRSDSGLGTSFSEGGPSRGGRVRRRSRGVPGGPPNGM